MTAISMAALIDVCPVLINQILHGQTHCWRPSPHGHTNTVNTFQNNVNDTTSQPEHTIDTNSKLNSKLTIKQRSRYYNKYMLRVCFKTINCVCVFHASFIDRFLFIETWTSQVFFQIQLFLLFLHIRVVFFSFHALGNLLSSFLSLELLRLYYFQVTCLARCRPWSSACLACLAQCSWRLPRWRYGCTWWPVLCLWLWGVSWLTPHCIYCLR